MNGIINIYKEAGYTSFDVVARLRGILREKKIGHTGTLDPDATGVLPVCIGNATKICELLTDKDKVYEAVLQLGLTTDTQDSSGHIVSDRSDMVNALSKEHVCETIMSYVGDYEQIPPMYSALKVGGRKLCDLAREGIEVERKPRLVHIYDIEIIQVKLPFVTMRVHCSKGTYIRTLCADIGEKLGVGGLMKSLVRTRVSRFCVEQSLTLEQVEAHRDAGTLDTILISVDHVFDDYPALSILPTETARKKLYNGNRLQISDVCESQKEMIPGAEMKFRMYDPKGTFFGIYAWDCVRSDYKSIKMFFS